MVDEKRPEDQNKDDLGAESQGENTQAPEASENTDMRPAGLVSEPESLKEEDGQQSNAAATDDSHSSDVADPFEFHDPQNHQPGKSDDIPFFVIMKTLNNEQLKELERSINNDTNMTDKEKAKAKDAISEALELRHADDSYVGLKDAPSMGWRQAIETHGRKIAMSVRKLKPLSGKLSGTQALQYVNNHLGNSSSVFIPLWNSGFNVTVGNIKESEVQALVAKLNLSKAELGYITRGAMFSGEDSIISGMLADFFFSHIITTSLKEYDEDVLRQLILSSDLDPILLGMLASIHVKGYPITNTCVRVATQDCNYGTSIKVDEKTGEYKHDSLVDFKKLLWVNRKRLKLEDIEQVGAKAGTTSLEDVEKYQERHRPVNKKVYEVATKGQDGSTVTYTLIGKHPSLQDYLDNGKHWVNAVIDMVNNVIQQSEFENRNEKEISRFNMMMHFAKSTSSGRHLPWIDEIEITTSGDDFDDGDRTVRVQGREAIGEVLSEAFSDKHSDAVDKALVAFKESATMTVAGLPNYKCPSCGHGQADPNSKYPTLIPINILHYFFIIGGWRYQKVEMKDF